MSEKKEEEVLIGDNVEGFTPDDYLQVPSWGTVSMEYPDERGDIMKKSNVFLNNTPVLNQGNVGACSVFGVVKAENESDFFDEKKILDAMKLWKEAVKDGRVPNGGKSGWSMSGALNLMKDKGYISGWYFCNDIDSIRDSLERRHLCYTGTRCCNRSETKKTGVFTKRESQSTGHLFAIIGIDFDNECLWAANSWGEDWGIHDGLFKIPFSNMIDLYTIVAIMDTPKVFADVDIQKDVADSELMKERGIWNGTNPDGNLWKPHAVYMIMRAIFSPQISDEDALAIAEAQGFVQNMSIPLTRRHFLIMLFRVAYGSTNKEDMIPEIMKLLGVVKTTDYLDDPLTRYHASLIIARMLRNLGRIE